MGGYGTGWRRENRDRINISPEVHVSGAGRGKWLYREEKETRRGGGSVGGKVIRGGMLAWGGSGVENSCVNCDQREPCKLLSISLFVLFCDKITTFERKMAKK